MATGTTLKIFGLPWHIGHQHSLFKLMDKYDVEFYLLENNVRRWKANSHRKLHPKVKRVSCYEPGKYDLALLHLDQQCVNPDIGKGHLYRELNEVIQDIPKIVINHGTPDYKEMYDEDMVINGGRMKRSDGTEKRVVGMKEMIGDNFMIVNSYHAVERWGFGYPVIHGIDPDEWPDMVKEPRISISLSGGGLDHYYNRQLLSEIKGLLREKTGYDLQHTNVNYTPEDGDDYKRFMSKSLIQIYPFRDSPMPRARTEGMMMGSCILSSRHQNADEFIETGVNGFILPDNPLSYVETIEQLINYHYQDCVKMGQRAKETAIKYFHIDDYLKDIWYVIEQVANGKKPEWNGEKRW